MRNQTHKNLRGSPNLATSTGKYRRILLSNVGITTSLYNRRTIEISLLLGENTSLTLSQIPHNFVGLLYLHSLYLLSNLSCGVHIMLGCIAYLQASIHARDKGQGKWPSGQVARGKWCPIGASQLASQKRLWDCDMNLQIMEDYNKMFFWSNLDIRPCQ